MPPMRQDHAGCEAARTGTDDCYPLLAMHNFNLI